jgi:hypothetical protein
MPDGGGSVCYPTHPAWDRLAQIFLSAQQADGADTFIGRRLPELFRQAGLAAAGMETKADIYPDGPDTSGERCAASGMEGPGPEKC